MAGRSTTTTATKPKRAAARQRAASKTQIVGEGLPTADVPSPEEIARDILRAQIDSLAHGGNKVPGRGGMNVQDGETQRNLPETDGLQLEEISQLLQQREQRGYMRGHGDGYREARVNVARRIERARSEAVAGTLIMVGGQLEKTLHALAQPGEDGKRAAAENLAVLMAELARAADRYADGQEVLG